MKQPKPGQFWPYRGIVLRAMKRTLGCTGCIFEDCISTCPNVQVKNSKQPTPDCYVNGIILVKPW